GRVQMSVKDYERLVVRETPDALFVLSPDNRVVYWNSGAEHTFGYTSEEALGRTVSELVVPPEGIEADHAFQQEALKNNVANCETLRRKKDGSLIYVNISVRTVRNARGEVEC